MRIISNRSPHFSGGGYHYGSVWPLFTGWASVGEYRYHRAFPAYANLRANALLALDGSLGHVTEVLSGAYYQSLSTSSPHQSLVRGHGGQPIVARHVWIAGGRYDGDSHVCTARSRRLDLLRD